MIFVIKRYDLDSKNAKLVKTLKSQEKVLYVSIPTNTASGPAFVFCFHAFFRYQVLSLHIK